MKPSRGKYIIYAIILLIAIIFPILIYVFSTSVCTPELSIVVTVLTITLDVLALAYFIVQDLVSNSRTIAHHGSLSLFETVDREAVSKNVIERLKEHPDAHVVYMACGGLPRIELENIKQRIYEDLTNYKKIDGEKSSRRNRLCISNVFLPAALDMQELNEQVFYSRRHVFEKSISVYIYDSDTANGLYIQQIGNRLDNMHGKKHNAANNTYIVFLDNRTKPEQANADMPLAITRSDLQKLIAQATGLEESALNGLQIPACCAGGDADHSASAIQNVFLVGQIFHEKPIYKAFIEKQPNLFFVLYLNAIGEYRKALGLLDEYIQNNCDSADGELQYYLCYLHIDTLHLLNYYHQALVECESLIAELDADYLEDISLLRIETSNLQAHILKHMGYFTASECLDCSQDYISTDANTVLANCMHQPERCKKMVINRHFSDLFGKVKVLRGDIVSDSANAPVGQSDIVETALKLFSDSRDPKDMMYYAAFLAYKNPERALQYAEDVSDYYEKIDHRLKYNARYVKAEILRVLGDYNAAYTHYIRASGMADGHLDINLLDQTFFSLKALEVLGLVGGMASDQIEAYRAAHFDQNLRRDANDLDGQKQNDDTKTILYFNEALRGCITQPNIALDRLKALLAENIFIIL